MVDGLSHPVTPSSAANGRSIMLEGFLFCVIFVGLCGSERGWFDFVHCRAMSLSDCVLWNRPSNREQVGACTIETQLCGVVMFIMIVFVYSFCGI